MKKLAIYGLFGVLSFASLAPSAFAQMQSLEYPGGPTSGVTKAEIEELKKLPSKLNLDITRLLEQVKMERDPSLVKKTLIVGMETIVSRAGNQLNNTLLKESIASGLSLYRLIDAMTIKQGLSRTPPGIIRQEVRVLKHALERSQKYFEKDQTYLVDRMNGTERKTEWVYFARELAGFVITMSDGVLSAPASYGMVRWALGVLEVKLMDDYNRAGFIDAIKHLDQDLNAISNPMPDLMLTPSAASTITDTGFIEKTRQLKLTWRFANQDLDAELTEMKKALKD